VRATGSNIALVRATTPVNAHASSITATAMKITAMKISVSILDSRHVDDLPAGFVPPAPPVVNDQALSQRGSYIDLVGATRAAPSNIALVGGGIWSFIC
jgi:hypothetical protein